MQKETGSPNYQKIEISGLHGGEDPTRGLLVLRPCSVWAGYS